MSCSGGRVAAGCWAAGYWAAGYWPPGAGRRVLGAGHRDLRGKTVPSKSLRAVRTTPERITVGGWLVVSTSASTSR